MHLMSGWCDNILLQHSDTYCIYKAAEGFALTSLLLNSPKGCQKSHRIWQYNMFPVGSRLQWAPSPFPRAAILCSLVQKAFKTSDFIRRNPSVSLPADSEVLTSVSAPVNALPSEKTNPKGKVKKWCKHIGRLLSCAELWFLPAALSASCNMIWNLPSAAESRRVCPSASSLVCSSSSQHLNFLSLPVGNCSETGYRGSIWLWDNKRQIHTGEFMRDVKQPASETQQKKKQQQRSYNSSSSRLTRAERRTSKDGLENTWSS